MPNTHSRSVCLRTASIRSVSIRSTAIRSTFIRSALLTLLWSSWPTVSRTQEAPAAWSEAFDSAVVPLLPTGWASSTARDGTGDFSTTLSGASSPPACAVSSNATLRQSLTSPPLVLTGWRSCAVSWNERRSASHDASVSLHASTDGGATFHALTSAPLPPPGGTSYAARAVPLPAWTDDQPALLLRWIIEGDGTGATGTIRIDDVLITGRPARDLGITLDSVRPARPLPGMEATIHGRVVNSGLGDESSTTVSWQAGEDRTGVPPSGGDHGSLDAGPVAAGESAPFEFRFVRPSSGSVRIVAAVIDPGGMVASNDTAVLLLPPAAAPGSVVITEVMYDPLPGFPEYVELFNRSDAAIDLRGWRLVDEETDSTGGRLDRAVGPEDSAGVILPAGGYLVCGPDTAIAAGYQAIPPGTLVIDGVGSLSLNNGGDALVLFDGAAGIIDRVDYDPAWHTPVLDDTRGRSLERIDPASPGNEGWNWGTSAAPEGGTPGAPNSLAPAVHTGGPGLECVPNPFSPDGDGFEDVTLISFRPGTGQVIARVRIFDAAGRPVRTLTAGGYIGPEGSFVWNGFDDRGRKAPIGIYVVVADAVDGTGERAVTLRGVVVVAGRL